MDNLKDNIQNTIGVPYQIIAIDNTIEKLSISAAYNKGASQSIYDILVFSHEDIAFKSNDWGRHLSESLKESPIGLVGACGSTVKPNVPTGWTAVPIKYYRSTLLQRNENGNSTMHDRRDKKNANDSTVSIVDGLFMATRKEIWLENKFDEENFDGFHFYDQDYSMQINTTLKIIINHNIIIEHFSLGKKDSTWLKYSRVFYSKWKNHLPMSVEDLSNKTTKEIEYLASFNYLLHNYGHNVRDRFVFSFLLKLVKFKPFGRLTLSALKLYFK